MRILGMLAVLIAGFFLLRGVGDLPAWGDPHSPANASPVSRHYLTQAGTETAVPNVVTAILDVSKIEAGTYAAQPEPFRFAETVDRVHAMMRMQADAREIDLSVRVPAECGEINADRRAVQQVLINLVSNAIKFTPEGGTVEIGAQRLGSHLHFWVSDTGIGIAPDDLKRLGQPFTQVQNEYTR